MTVENADTMAVEDYDRDHRVGDRRWALFLPGMGDEMKLATDGELIDFSLADPADRNQEGIAFSTVVRSARPGDWMPFRHGIAIRLGALIDPVTFE